MDRMMRMEPIQREILDKIEDTRCAHRVCPEPGAHTQRDAHSWMTVFNNFDRRTSLFMEQLEEHCPVTAEHIL